MFGFWPILSGEFYHCFWIKEIWHGSTIKSHNFCLPNRERNLSTLFSRDLQTLIQFKTECAAVQTIRLQNQTLVFTISRGSLYSILFYCTIEKCHFSNIFYISKGHYEIKFMSRKISISKNKFYQEIPMERMRYLKQRTHVNTTLLDRIKKFCKNIFSSNILTVM